MRATMFTTDRPAVSSMHAALDRLVRRDLAAVGDDGVIRVVPGVAAEELDSEERALVYKLLGYEQPDSDKPLIARRAGVVGGRAAVAGRRLPVWQIANAVRRGASRAELRMQTGLSDEQIRQALAYAEAHAEEIDRDIFENDRVTALLAGD